MYVSDVWSADLTIAKVLTSAFQTYVKNIHFNGIVASIFDALEEFIPIPGDVGELPVKGKYPSRTQITHIHFAAVYL